jgi:adenylate cyclase
VIAEGRGRIVKTIGDEVLFVADDVDDGAATAAALQDRVRAEAAPPPRRSASPSVRCWCGRGTATARS